VTLIVYKTKHPRSESGVVIFKLLRSAKDVPEKGKVAIVGRNPDAIRFSGYTDRVVFDELGLFDEYIALERKAQASALIQRGAV
jgi:hypothetical protein